MELALTIMFHAMDIEEEKAILIVILFKMFGEFLWILFLRTSP